MAGYEHQVRISKAVGLVRDHTLAYTGRTRRTTLLLTVALAALIFASPALAAPGDLDTFFGNNGTVVTRFFDGDGSVLFSPGSDLAIQPDGKVVVAGGNTLARYNPDGALDTSFDGDGKVVGSGGGNDIAIQPDGKIVVVGQFSSENSSGQLDFDFQVLRYNADGSPDTTFDGDGRLTTPVGPGNAFDSAHGVGVQPDGKIVVVGYSHDYGTKNRDLALVRYNPNGSLDTTFDTDGKLTTDIGSGQDAAADISLRPDGKMVVAGSSGHTTNEYGVTIDDDFVVARYNPDGSLDTTFDTDGKLTTSFGSGKDGAGSLALQPDGKMVVAGASQHATESNSNTINDFAVARYNPDGSLDTTFDGDGKLTTSVGSHNDVANDLVLQGDGKIVAVGKTTVMDADGSYRKWEIVLARYNPDGSLDPLFGGDGKASGPEVNQQNVAAGLRADGKILVSSTSTNQGQLLARYYGGDDITAPGPVTDFAAAPRSGALEISLSWTNPPDDSLEATRVLRSVSGHATSPTQTTNQAKIYDGSAASYIDTGLTFGTRYYYTAFARDTSGNWSVAGAASAIADPTPPETTITSGPSGPTNTNKPTFTFSGSDNNTPRADLLYSYKLDAEAWTEYSGETSATLGGAQGLADGPHTFYVRSKDVSGHIDRSPAERSFTVDTVVPATTINSGPSGTVSAGSARFEFSSEAGAAFRCKLDSAPNFTDCSSPMGYTGLANGDHTFQVQATDAAGNAGPVANRIWTVAPETTSQLVAAGETVTSDAEGDGATATDPVETSITSPVAGPVSIVESANVTESSAGYSLLGQQVNIEAPASTADNPLRFAFVFDSSLIPAGEDQNTVQIFRNGVQVQNCADPTSGSASPDPCVLSREPLAGGDVRFTVLTSHASAWNFGVDDTPPAPPVISRPANNSYDPDGTIAFSGTAEARSTVRIFEGTTLKGTATAGTTGAWTTTLTGVANGRHTYTAKATDAANNTSAASAPKTVTVDTIKPTISAMSPRHASITRDTTPTIKATVKDNNPLAKANVKLYVAGRLISTTKYSYNPATGALVYNSPKLPKGKKTVKIVATDAAGNALTKSWYFTIK